MKFFCFRVPPERKHTPLPRSDPREPAAFSFAVPRDSWFWLELLDWDPDWDDVDFGPDEPEPGD